MRTTGLLAAPDWVSLGLVLAIAGAFLLANGILFRNPKLLVQERFGRGPRSLRSIRELMFHRVQMGLGFGYLLASFGLQLYARIAPPQPAPRPASIAACVGIVLLVTLLLAVGGWHWSLLSLRRTVRSWLAENPAELEGNAGLAREVGALFEIDPHADDTVPSYVGRLRRALELEPVPRRAEPEHGPEHESSFDLED